jgi:hypothetical protein
VHTKQWHKLTTLEDTVVSAGAILLWNSEKCVGCYDNRKIFVFKIVSCISDINTFVKSTISGISVLKLDQYEQNIHMFLSLKKEDFPLMFKLLTWSCIFFND